jgi:uncharacterized protein YqeY
MSLKEQITKDLKEAMKAKDEVRLDVVRGIRGEILNYEKSGKGDISDEEILKSVKTQIKERRELIESAQKANRSDIYEEEEKRVRVLKGYLPPALSSDELKQLVDDAVVASGAETVKDMGRVMGIACKAVQASGKDADNRELSEMIKQRLS